MRVRRKKAVLRKGGSDRLRVSLVAACVGFELKGKFLRSATMHELPEVLAEESDAIGGDGYALGNYGLAPLDDAHLVETRGDEMLTRVSAP